MMVTMDNFSNNKPLSLTTLVPDSWFTQKENCSFWLTGYRIHSIEKESFKSKFKIIDLANIRAIILQGTVRYFDTKKAKIEVVSENQLRVDASKFQWQETPEGFYLLLLAPFDIGENIGNELITRQKISVAAALFAAFNGRNMVHEHIFDNIVKMSGGVSSFSSPTLNSLFYPKANVSELRINKIIESDLIISSLDESLQERIHISLRWFISAIYESGVDAYLKYWIAIETIAMPDTTNIGIIKKIISKIYNMSIDEVETKFQIGKIFGLRGRIVHDGQIISIHGNLLKFIEALYIDILFELLHLPSEKKALTMINSNEFDFNKYLIVK
jgi:hypothetical protein